MVFHMPGIKLKCFLTDMCYVKLLYVPIIFNARKKGGTLQCSTFFPEYISKHFNVRPIYKTYVQTRI